MMRPDRLTTLLIVLVATLAFSVNGTAQEPACTPGLPAWSYSSTSPNGPARWATLSAVPYCSCAEAITNQSPINIVPPGPTAGLPPIKFSYALAKGVWIVNDGETITVDYWYQGSGNNSVSYDGKTYYLVNFHFHVHSEHQIGGQYAPMEVHLVHKSSKGEYLVIAVLYTEGASNHIVNKIWNVMLPSSGTPPKETTLNINAYGLLPGTKDWNRLAYYTYQGSLTVPPCTQPVKWLVLVNQTTVSSSELAAWAKEFPDDNARPLQTQTPQPKVTQSTGNPSPRQ